MRITKTDVRNQLHYLARETDLSFELDQNFHRTKSFFTLHQTKENGEGIRELLTDYSTREMYLALKATREIFKALKLGGS